MTKNISDSVECILIDEEKIYCPYREKTVGRPKKITYSDHCAIIAEYAIATGKIKKKAEKRSGWKYCEEGYKLYQLESDASIHFDLAKTSAT